MYRIYSFLKIATLFCILLLVAIFSCQKIWDLDIWMHLQTGRYILQHLNIPQTDIYSYTSQGRFWFNPDWLFAVIVYPLYQFLGASGLILLKIILFLSTFYLLYRSALRAANWPIALILLFFTVLVGKERIIERPEMFSFLFTVIYLLVLNRFRSEDTKLLWLLPVLQILWTNLHTFSIMGILFVWVFIIGESISFKIELPWKWNKSSVMDSLKLKKLLLVGLLHIIAIFISPYGVKVVKEYAALFNWMYSHSDVLAGGIVELRPPFIGRNILNFEFIYYKILILVSQISFLINFRRINLSNLFLYFIFLCLSLSAIRNIAFFGVITMPILAENLMPIFLNWQRISKRWIVRFCGRVSTAFACLAIIIACIHFGLEVLNASFVMHGKLQRRFGWGESPIHPKEAIDFIIHNGIKGNAFQNFGFGGYFIWRAWPKHKVFIDGRTSVYSEDHLHFYANVFLYPYIFNQLVNDYNINYFLLDINSSKVLLKRLYDDSNWRLVFFDANGLVFVKNSPENKSVIDKYAVDFKNWHDPEPDIEPLDNKLVTASTYPLSYFKKGVFFDMLGNIELARYEYERAVKANPYLGEIYNNIGVTYQAQEKFEEAKRFYEKAVSVNPRLPSAHANLGFLYEKEGKKEEAVREYKKAIASSGFLSGEAHNNLGCIYFGRGLYRKALNEFKKAIGMNYGRAEYHFNLGSVYQAMGLIEQAIYSYKEATRIEPDNIKAYNNLGACYLAKGELLEAKRNCEKVLEIDPDNELAKKNLSGVLQKQKEQKSK